MRAILKECPRGAASLTAILPSRDSFSFSVSLLPNSYVAYEQLKRMNNNVKPDWKRAKNSSFQLWSPFTFVIVYGNLRFPGVELEDNDTSL